MARVIGVGLLILIAVSPALVQDAPKPPISAAVKLVDAPSPIHVADRPAGLQINLLDSAGKPAPLNGTALTLGSTDAKCSINGFQVVLDNGVAVLQNAVQFFTPGVHEITATSKDGSIKGKIGNIKVEALQPKIKFRADKPEVMPGRLHSGSGVWVRSKLESDGKEVPNKEVRIKGSKGMAIYPQRVFTNDLGFFECFVFTPEFCITGPGSGPGPIGTLSGDATLKLECFVDANGDHIFNGAALEPGEGIGPIEITTPCPIDLLNCARLLLEIIVSGGVIEPPPPGPGPIEVLTGSSVQAPKKPAKPKDVQARLTNALKSLVDILNDIDSGKWKSFSKTAEGIQKVIKTLQGIPVAAPVVARLECAALLIGQIPDVKSIRLSIQDKNGAIKVPEGFKQNVSIELIGNSGQVIPATSFPLWARPYLRNVSVDQRATVTFTPGFDVSFLFECTATGPTKLTVELEFRCFRLIIIDDGEVVEATNVPNFVIEPPMTTAEFPLTKTFTVVQEECQVLFVSATNLKNGTTRTVPPDKPPRLIVCMDEPVRLTALTGSRRGKESIPSAHEAEWLVIKDGVNITSQLRAANPEFAEENLGWTLPGVPGTYEITAFCDDDLDTVNNPENQRNVRGSISIQVIVLPIIASIEDFQDRVVPRYGSRTIQVKSPEIKDDERLRLVIEAKATFQMTDSTNKDTFAGKASFKAGEDQFTIDLPDPALPANKQDEQRKALKSDAGLTVPIFGRETSPARRRLQLKFALLKAGAETPCGDPLDFTVFEVRLIPTPPQGAEVNGPNGDLTAIPETVDSCSDRKLRAVYKEVVGQETEADPTKVRFGVLDRNNGITSGIYIRGEILPKDLKEEDFFPVAHGEAICHRDRGFNFERFRDVRAYKQTDGCLLFVPTVRADRIASDRFNDDANDGDESLMPKANVPNDTGLYIHAIDAPTTGGDIASPGPAIVRILNFTEIVTYRRSPCSQPLLWSTRHNVRNKGIEGFEVSGVMRTDAHLPLTPPVAEAAASPFELKDLDLRDAADKPLPAEFKSQNGVKAKIKGGDFTLPKEDCFPALYFILEKESGAGTTIRVIPGKEFDFKQNEITATFDFLAGEAVPGVYRLVVIIQDQAGQHKAAANPITIKIIE